MGTPVGDDTVASIMLDRSGEPWIGWFPGLGEVRVHADGHAEVRALPADRHDPDTVGSDGDEGSGPEDLAWRERALRHGWAEPLSFARRGFSVVDGAAVVPNGSDRCLVMTGPIHDVSIVAMHLVEHRGRVVALRVVPVTFEGTALTAHPTETPLVMATRRVRRSGLQAAPVRRASDAVIVDLPRAESPHLVGGIVSVTSRRPGEPLIESLTGTRRLEIAASLVSGGVFAHEASAPADLMKRHLAIASLPCVVLYLDDDPTLSLDSLTDWWSAL